jgi:hypothetical protein
MTDRDTNLSAPGWLNSLRTELATVTCEAAKKMWPGADPDRPAFFNYRLEHVRQVEREALALLDAVGGDREIVLASVWLHDWFQPLFDGPDAHGKMAAGWAQVHLAARGFPVAKVEAVCFAVANHSNPPHTIAHPGAVREARLLWDADKLAHLGAHEMLTVIFNNLARDRIESLGDDPAFPERTMTIRDFVVARLQKLGRRATRADLERFYFKVSQDRARERYRVIQLFYASLYRQIGVL